MIAGIRFQNCWFLTAEKCWFYSTVYIILLGSIGDNIGGIVMDELKQENMDSMLTLKNTCDDRQYP